MQYRPSSIESHSPSEFPPVSWRGLAIGLPICTVLAPGLAGFGGLAPAAVLVLTAISVAAMVRPSRFVPLAQHSHLSAELRKSCGEIICAGVVGASFAPLIHDFGSPVAMVVAIGLWLIAIALGRLGRDVLFGLFACYSLLGVACLCTVVVQGVGWTLLEPQWSTWPHWLGPSAMGGVVVGGAGVGLGALHNRVVPPEEDSRHWVALGISLISAAVGFVLIAYEWEYTAPDPTFNLLPILGWVAVMTAASALQLGPRSPWAPWTGALFCAWFAGPGFSAVGFWWVTLLPLMILGYLLLLGLQGWRAVLVGLVLLVAMLTAWPGLPSQPEAAGALGLTIVFVFWLLASRGALARHI